MLDKIINTAIMEFVGLLFTCVSLHITTYCKASLAKIKSNKLYCNLDSSSNQINFYRAGQVAFTLITDFVKSFKCF